MNRWALTLTVTVALWAGYRGYAHWLGPLTEPAPPPPTLEIATLPLPLHPEDFADADRYLTATEWTQKAKFKIKHSDNGYFYFDDYDTDGPRVELKPFAMVIRPDPNLPGPPYSVVCESARLLFEHPFQIGGESPGRLIAAVLEGKFRIAGPNALIIEGRDCRFSEDSHQLYSDHPITFQYRPEDGNVRVVRGSADKLQIDFVPTTFSPHGRDMPRVGDAERLTLRRNVEFYFRYHDGTEMATTRVSSAGPFVFDFLKSMATFQDKVEINRPTKSSDGKVGHDSLKAHWLALQFEERRAGPAPPPSSASIGGRASEPVATGDSASPLGKLQFRSMRALARTADQPVVLRSLGANFTGQMRELYYDTLERAVLMQSPGEGVRLDNGDAILWSPRLIVYHDESGDLAFVEAQREGRMDFERPAEEGQDPQKFHALWNHRLTMQPQPERGLMIVTLEGDARVIQPGGVGILSDRLTLDVDAEGLQETRATGPLTGLPGTAPAGNASTARAGAASASPAAAATSSTAPAGSKEQEGLPLRRAVAEGHVAMAGPQFEIETSRLDVTFQAGRLPKGPTNGTTTTHTPPPLPAPRLTASSSPTAPRTVLRPAARGTLLEPVFASVPSPAIPDPKPVWPGPGRGAVPVVTSRGLVPTSLLAGGESFESASPVVAAAPGSPRGGLGSDDRWDVKARSIKALVLQDPESQQSDLRDVVGEGEVVIQQLPPVRSSLAGPAQPQDEPLTVTGDRLHMVNSGGIDQALHLTGAPAHLRRGGMHIEGNELFFDREENTARVIGKGMLQAPVGESLTGEARAQPSRLDVHWLREMVFNGSVARFIEGVRTRLDDSVMRCDEMEVTLNQRVDFSADKPDTEGLSIQNVLCLRGVEVEYYQWQTPQHLSARAVGKAGEFQLRYDTGDFEARGGGRLEVWQQSEENRVDVEPQAVARANQPVSADKLPWQYTHVVFRDRIVGNMRKKNGTLYDRVQVTHAPVERSTQVFTRDELSRDTESARNGVWMGCDELQISLHPSPGEERDFIQILGIGKRSRVELEGRLFQANSDTLSYDESTKFFTLRGMGRNKVSIARQEYPGARYQETTGQSVQFNPALGSGSIQGSDGAFGAP